ncbi:uncharacterized protein LOC121053569 isoform X2 [Oryza brachyantha]|uniref:uncharacterized protein LOC121053566 isoform X2 n=1 Tax=Oryza brachyantha TaxID=4533 RepID=UPI001ADA8F83|nr:uncharacterized protein LOC121053566 isoform X2 [Oryza brachyantha]XP_040377023.1 uncharacterized protein LOC121053569 isoform X2 [Oryza brachyantha]
MAAAADDDEIGRVMSLFFTDGVLGLDGGVSDQAEREEYDEEDESGCLEPFFYDEAEAVAEAAVAAEKRRLQEEERAREQEQRAKEKKARKALFKRIRKYDPKRGTFYFTRYSFGNPLTFDLNEESPLGPMRYTDKIYSEHEETFRKCSSANILSVKIDDPLILTGPNRGLVLIDDINFEVDLRIKDDRLRGKKKELNRGTLRIDGILSTRGIKMEVENDTLEGKLGTVEMKYAVVKKEAVEATVEIKVLEGCFHGEVSACTTNIQDIFMLLDGRTCGARAANRDAQLSRRVIAVHRKEKLLLTIVNQDDAVPSGCVTQTVGFTPNINGSEETEVTCGSVRMVVKVTWSLMLMWKC